MPLTDAQILVRRCLPSEGNELAHTADDTAGHDSDRLSVPSRAEPAPAAAQLTPLPAAVGDLIDTPVHGETCGD